MKRFVLKVDATFGVKAKPGDTLPPGHEIGLAPETHQPIVLAESATVTEVTFDPARHEFRIVVETA